MKLLSFTLIQVSHPIMAEWVNVLIGASVGFFLGIAADLLRSTVNDWKERRRMRRALYVELLNIYNSIQFLITGNNGRKFDDDTVFNVVKAQRLDAFEHAKQNPGVFYCLGEAHSLNHAFTNMHETKFLANKENATETRDMAQAFLEYIQSCVAMQRFRRKLLKRI